MTRRGLFWQMIRTNYLNLLLFGIPLLTLILALPVALSFSSSEAPGLYVVATFASAGLGIALLLATSGLLLSLFNALVLVLLWRLMTGRAQDMRLAQGVIGLMNSVIFLLAYRLLRSINDSALPSISTMMAVVLAGVTIGLLAAYSVPRALVRHITKSLPVAKHVEADYA